jgi:predicted HTH domain antitoxin
VTDLPDSVPHRYRRLVAGATELDIGLDDEDDVVAAALAEFFERHEDVRHAAVAELYRDSELTTGAAARLADVSPGPEIQSLLRDHGVEPRVGPADTAEGARKDAAAARRAFGDDADDEKRAESDDSEE